MEPGFFDVTLGSLLSSGIVAAIAAAIVGALFLKRNKTAESEIKEYFDVRLKIFESKRS